MKRLSAALLLVSLGWTACSLAGPAATKTVAAGAAFSLRPGETAQLAGGTLRVGFEAVLSDSRCPKGAQCFWAGEARVRVWLQEGSGPRQAHELRSSGGPPGGSSPAALAGQALQFVSLEPHPVAGRTAPPQETSLTLRLQPQPQQPAESHR